MIVFGVAIKRESGCSQEKIAHLIRVHRLRHDDARAGVGYITRCIVEPVRILDFSKPQSHLAIPGSYQGAVNETIVQSQLAAVCLARPASQYLPRNQPVRIRAPGQIGPHFSQLGSQAVVAFAADIVVAGVNQALVDKTMRLNAMTQFLRLHREGRKEGAERGKRFN